MEAMLASKVAELLLLYFLAGWEQIQRQSRTGPSERLRLDSRIWENGRFQIHIGKCWMLIPLTLKCV